LIRPSSHLFFFPYTTLFRSVLALGSLSGCSRKMSPVQNLPPDTRLFVQWPVQVDTVSHRVHLYWFGTDPDGEVVAYAFRFVYPRSEERRVGKECMSGWW